MSARNEVTIYDIAEALSLSPSTVSRALTPGASVHQKTREKVINMARDLGYRQNIFASNLRSQRTRLLGVVVPHINDRESGNVLAQVEIMARLAGYEVIVSQSLNDPELHLSSVESMCRKRVDGLLILPANFVTPVSQPVEITELKIPSVFIEGWSPVHHHDKTVDRLNHTAYVFTKYLFHKGCKRVGYVATKPNQTASGEVYKGYCRALEENNTTADITLGSSAYFEQAMRKCGDLLTAPIAPDGIIFLDETLTALTVPSLRGAHSYVHGQTVDISNFTESDNPGPSTMEKNDAEAGKVGAGILITLMHQTDGILNYQ
jgi:LacI family transcriptional regulator